MPVSALPRERLGPAMGAGLRYVAMSPNILKVLLRSLPLRPDQRRGDGAPAAGRAAPGRRAGRSIYGVLLGAFGVGAIGGAFLGTPAARRLSSEAIVRLAFAGFAAGAAVARAQRQRLAQRRRHASSAAPAGCWRWRSSTPPCSSRPRAGWSAGRWRSTRPRPSAAWRSGAGSGAASPRRATRLRAARRRRGDARRRRRRLPAAAAGAGRARPRPAEPLDRARGRLRPQAAERPDRGRWSSTGSTRPTCRSSSR